MLVGGKRSSPNFCDLLRKPGKDGKGGHLFLVGDGQVPSHERLSKNMQLGCA
jgi:hypothetical protein